jgi:aspartyl/asparaginyl-tRNA synthetase
MLNKRHLVLRREKVSNYMKLRSVVTQAFRQHYFDRGYYEVTPPTLVQTQAEGGSELFSFKFFDEPVCSIECQCLQSTLSRWLGHERLTSTEPDICVAIVCVRVCVRVRVRVRLSMGWYL